MCVSITDMLKLCAVTDAFPFLEKAILKKNYTSSSFYNFNNMKEDFAALTSTWNNSSILRAKHEKGLVEIITLATRVQSIVWTKLTVTARRRITLLSEKRTMSATSNPVCSKTTSGADYRSVFTNNPQWRNASSPWFIFRSESWNTSS